MFKYFFLNHNLLQVPSTNQNHFQRQHFPWDFLLVSSDPTHAPSLLCQAALSCHGIALCNLSFACFSLRCCVLAPWRDCPHTLWHWMRLLMNLRNPKTQNLFGFGYPFFGMTASCGSPPWLWALPCVRSGWSSSACMVVVPAKLFIMWSRVGREMSKPVHVLWRFHWRCCSLKPLEHMFITSTFSHTMQAIVCTKVKAMCCSVAMY